MHISSPLSALLFLALSGGMAGAQDGPVDVAESLAARSDPVEVPLLERPAHLDVHEVRLSRALLDLQARSGVSLVYSPSRLGGDAIVTCECATYSVRDALVTMLEGTNIRFSVMEPHILLEEYVPGEMPEPRVMLAGAAAPAITGVPVTREELRNPGLVARAGTISGLVVEERTLRPLAGAQVYIVDSSIGTLTNAQGRFVLQNVPAGQVTVAVRLIGYGAAEQAVTVLDGQSTDLSITLQQQALALDDIVVTGTAGQARRREVGNSISAINVADVALPASSVDRMLQSQAAGVMINESSGSVGSGTQIRLRGAISVSQSNQPLIYIDGIRVNSEPYAKNTAPFGNTLTGSANVTASPLADIPATDIERIEVIKGAAATTLYGTEAAAGVIQIFTKRGAAGAARWTAQMTQGFNRLMPFAPEPRPYLSIDTYLRRNDSLGFLPGSGVALRQGYSLSVSGGAQALQYFASLAYDSNEGVLPLDLENKIGVRGNFTFSPIDRLQVSWNTSYVRNSITNTPAGNAGHGLTLNAFRLDRGYFGTANPDTIRTLLDQEIDTWIDRFITGATINYAQTDNLDHRLTVGYDLASQENRNYRPFGYVASPSGSIMDARYNNTVLTLDYVSSYRWQTSRDLALTFSVGGQSVSNESHSVVVAGQDLPGPGRATVSNAAIRIGDESRMRVINAGFFGQTLFSFRDRYFLTTGVRVDGNSAFGEELGLQAYPKMSLAYVISDEAFWPSNFGDVKLRAAYGQSGRAPGAFDAVKTWNTPGYGTDPAFSPRNLGNPNLGPERTSEIEVGADASFLDGRLSGELTYYYRKTTDALFNVRRPTSYGDVGSQLENVGSLMNSGLELSLNGSIVDEAKWGWTMGAKVYTNDSEILDLGGAEEFSAGGGWVRVGAPVMAKRGHVIVNKDEKAAPIIVRDSILGPQQPTLVFGLDTSVRLPREVTISARGEYQGGGWITDSSSGGALQRAVEWPTCTSAYANLAADRPDELTAWERIHCIQANYQSGFLNYPKDFFKMRDVTLSAPLGNFIPRASGATLQLSARNFYTWKNKDFPIFDPEMVANDGFGSQNTGITDHIPAAASFSATIRVDF